MNDNDLYEDLTQDDSTSQELFNFDEIDLDNHPRVTRWFIDDTAKIVNNTYGHRFNIGDIVKIYAVQLSKDNNGILKNILYSVCLESEYGNIPVEMGIISYQDGDTVCDADLDSVDYDHKNSIDTNYDAED